MLKICCLQTYFNDQSAYVGINVEDEDKEIFIKTDYPSETVVEDLYSSKSI